MDTSEKLVEQYLRNVGFTDVRYEPDGNVPPDFLADGRVAVEVRRLNQNHDDGSGKGPRGLEEIAISMWHRMGSYLTGLGPAPAIGQSWYVFYEFGRPVLAWKDLKPELDALLLPFMADPNPHPLEVTLSGGFSIDLRASGISLPTFFWPGGYSDKQSGGWLLAEVGSNLEHCITEKSAKIESYRAKYPEWWLVLPDHIALGLDDFDQDLFRDQVSIQVGGFDKIVLLDPRDASRAFDVVGPPHVRGA